MEPQVTGEQWTTTVSRGPLSVACAGSGGVVPSQGGPKIRLHTATVTGPQ
jgi:hypothetical protein